MTTLPQDVEADLRRRIFELEQRLEVAAAQRDEAVERQTATALVNFRLQNELRATAERQSAGAEILRTVANTSGDAEQSLQRIAETTARFFNAASVTIRIAKGDEWFQTVRVGASSQLTGWQPAAQLATRGKNLPATVYQENRQIHIPDLDNIDPSMADWPVTAARAGGIRTVCGTPLRREGKAIGALIVYRGRLAPFTPDELALQQSFADQAVIAIENARLFNETQEALARQTATADILRVINNSGGNLTPVFDCILEKAHDLCGAPCGSLQLYEDDRVVPVAIRGMPAPFAEHLRRGYPITAGNRDILLAAHPVQRGDLATIAEEEQNYQGARAAVELGGIRTLVAVPLLRNGTTFGRIVGARQEVRPFTDKQISLLQSFADQAVIAIENARLFNETQEALARQTATSDILRVIASSPADVQPVFDVIVERAVRLCGARMGRVYRYDGKLVHLVGGHGLSEPGRDSAQRPFPRPASDDTIVGRVMLSREPFILADLNEDDTVPPLSREMISSIGARSQVTMPMLLKGEPIGAITLSWTEPRGYNDQQIALLQTFADQAVIAIENTRLFKEVQARTRDLEEALEQQIATSEVLSVISSSAGDLAPVFDAMLGNAMQLCGANFGVLNTYDGAQFRTAATHGLPPAYDQYRRGRPLDYGPATAPARLLQGEPFVEIVDLLDSDAYRSGEPNRRALVDIGGARSLLAVPLIRDERVVGNVMIFRQEQRPFSEKQITLLQQFAAQAVIAIENARLLGELRARTDDLSESLQQQTATSEVLQIISSSPSDLAPVFEKMLENATRVCGAEFGSMNLVEGDAVRQVALYNAPAAFAAARVNKVSRPHPQSSLATAIRTKEVVHIADLRTTPAYLERYPATVELIELGGARTVVVVPMLRDNEVIGVITIYRQEIRPFDDKQIELVSNFAKQAVIAIENARLLGELRQRTADLSKSLDDLRTAQDRLIQTEKLASLGQLTAGIAHEIKNPLNFVNNFAALSAELTDELKDVLKPAVLDESMRNEVDELTGTLKDNLGKVVQHGKRADSIVKNMLLHSREGSGEHRPADVNALVDESLNLAYHGARAEKPQFNVALERDFDPEAGSADVFPQEITRVLLNLISNGFYAVSKRKADNGAADFEPAVRATTLSRGDRVEIRIRDNGTGIPPHVKEKMFNPFFTTKPAGEGTGLGLSMSHDIIVKQHGGTIEVATEPGQFTEFTIVLPRTKNHSNKTRG
jgi:two-component system, NtrC family, sensor kinase